MFFILLYQLLFDRMVEKRFIFVKDNSKSTLYLQLFYLKKCHKMAIQRNDLENCKNNQTKNIIYNKYSIYNEKGGYCIECKK